MDVLIYTKTTAMTAHFFYLWLHNTLIYLVPLIPWICIGILASFILKAFIQEKYIRKVLGGSSFLTIIIAEVIGALSPVSIIALLPLASSMIDAGAAPATLVAFLLAARAYNPEAIPVSISLMGIPITVANILIIFIGVTTCAVSLKKVHISILKEKNTNTAILKQTSIFIIYILIGTILAGLLTTVVSPKIIVRYGGNGIGGILFSLLSGFFIYLGFVGYFPIAKSFLDLGISHAAVVTFLSSCSIVNLTFILMFSRAIGRKATVRIFTIYAVIVTIMGLLLLFTRI